MNDESDEEILDTTLVLCSLDKEFSVHNKTQIFIFLSQILLCEV